MMSRLDELNDELVRSGTVELTADDINELANWANDEIERLRAEVVRLQGQVEELKRGRLPEWVKAMKAETLREAQDDGNPQPAT